MPPALILLVGMATILGAILLLRLNAFLALIAAAIVVSLLAPGAPAVKIARVAEGFGRTAGTIGIVIALAAITGKAMMDSGAADRIVRAFIALLGEKRSATALCATGYVLSIPVFFDTVFYLLVPLARSGYTRTNRYYLKYLLAIAAGAGATHTLVPPTPGPLAVAGTLGVDLGTMVLVGLAVALPAAGVGLLFAGWVDRRMPVVPSASAAEPAATQLLPGLVPSLLPIILPVLLISSNTVVVSMTARPGAHFAIWSALAPYTAIIGNPNLAMLAAMLPASGRSLPFHTVYVATAIASGSLVGTWMNDSGFWLFSKMGGVTEMETLKSWTPLLAVVGVTGMVTTVALALLVPLR